ncbi:MAG: hypothetical protein LUD02_08910 [Tannerellaceae bacterium]|nr:hypothetical protein [Tannerellaceae bacterium]MCD8264251.1 hypothetical protein [Tannerellaceae bacterium]
MNVKMHLNHLYALIVGIGICVGLSGCDNEKEPPLQIMGAEDNHLTLYHPNEEEGCVTIDGGARPYSVSCESALLDVYMEKWPNAFNYQTRGVGHAQVKVTDALGQSIYVDIDIRYREQHYEVIQHDVVVEGDQMTIAAQTELKEKALASIPVKEGGLYSFIYTENLAGTVYLYPHKVSSFRHEGTFRITTEELENNRPVSVYNLMVEDQQYKFIMNKYVPSKMADIIVPVALYEDLLEQFKPAYPEVGKVYSIQVIQPKAE